MVWALFGGGVPDFDFAYVGVRGLGAVEDIERGRHREGRSEHFSP